MNLAKYVCMFLVWMQRDSAEVELLTLLSALTGATNLFSPFRIKKRLTSKISEMLVEIKRRPIVVYLSLIFADEMSSAKSYISFHSSIRPHSSLGF